MPWISIEKEKINSFYSFIKRLKTMWRYFDPTCMHLWKFIMFFPPLFLVFNPRMVPLPIQFQSIWREKWIWLPDNWSEKIWCSTVANQNLGNAPPELWLALVRGPVNVAEHTPFASSQGDLSQALEASLTLSMHVVLFLPKYFHHNTKFHNYNKSS